MLSAWSELHTEYLHTSGGSVCSEHPINRLQAQQSLPATSGHLCGYRACLQSWRHHLWASHWWWSVAGEVIIVIISSVSAGRMSHSVIIFARLQPVTCLFRERYGACLIAGCAPLGGTQRSHSSAVSRQKPLNHSASSARRLSALVAVLSSGYFRWIPAPLEVGDA